MEGEIRGRTSWVGPEAAAVEAAAAVAGRLRRQALELEDIADRAAAVGALEWDSPAGRRFREYVAEQARRVRVSAERVHRAAGLAEMHARELQRAAPEGPAAGNLENLAGSGMTGPWGWGQG